jgi:hypothetical protein
VPARVKRVPPPPPPAQPVVPPDPNVDLDSSHPRVKEWVSRFTDGQPLRIGGPITPPPITDPSAIPDQPIFADEEELLVQPNEVPVPSAPPMVPAPQAVFPDELPLPPVPAAAPEPLPSAAPEPHAVELPRHEPLVTPEALTPPPLVLDEKPAEATPSGSMRRPASIPSPAEPPVASAPPQAPMPASPTPKASPARGSTNAPHAAKPGASTPKRPPQLPRAGATPPSAKHTGTPPRGAKPTPHAGGQPGAGRTPNAGAPRVGAPPVAQAAAGAGAQRANATPAAEPPAVLTKKDVKAHKPAQWDKDTKPVATPKPKPTVTVAPMEDDDINLPSPTVYRVLAALIPIVLILGMAATAIVLSRRSAFDRDPESTQLQASTSAAVTESLQAVPVEPVAPPAPAPPPLVVTPDSEVVPAPIEKARYCLSVGTYLFSDRARMRTEQLSRVTHMKSWIITTTADGSYTYRVMLGGFVKQADAERTADKLLSSGLVSEAMVEKLPPQ